MDLYDWNGNPIDMSGWLDLRRDTIHVGHTTVGEAVEVSTVWLGLDHNHGAGPPLIFETMVFGSDDVDLTDVQRRYPTREAAQAGHEAVVGIVTALLAGPPEVIDPSDVIDAPTATD